MGAWAKRLPGVTPPQVGESPWLRETLAAAPTDEAPRDMAVLEGVVLAAAAAAGVNRRDVATLRAGALLHEGVPHGWLSTARALKKLSAYHRGRWVTAAGSRLDAQLSFIGRALPPAPKIDRVAAVVQHRKDYTSSFTTDASLLSSCRVFAATWARRKLARFRAPFGGLDWPTSSSCLEAGASKGGLLGHLLGAVADTDLGIELEPTAVGQDAAMQGKFLQYALKHAEELPLHRVTCLSERGLKTRVVSVGPAWAQVLGHAVRRRLFKALVHTDGTFAPLRGAKDSELLSLFEGGHSEVLVSTDLTRATDLLPLDLCKAVVDGLEDSGKLSPEEVSVLRLLTGPQRLRYGSEEVVSSRGVLMGLPTSWTVLSLIHLWWIDEVRSTTRDPYLRKRHRASICGDDALLATTRAGADRYRAVVAACGGEASPGKHYECSLGSTRRGVFLEKLFEWGVSGSLLTEGSRAAAIPVKGLTSRSLPKDFSGNVPCRCDSTGILQILTLEALRLQNQCLRLPLEDYLSRRVPWLGKFAEEVLCLAPGFPLALGGWPFGRANPQSARDAASVWRSGGSFTLRIKLTLDSRWRLASEASDQGRSLAVAEGELQDIDRAVGFGGVPFEQLRPGLRVEDQGALWEIRTEDDRYVATCTPTYRAYCNFIPPSSPVFPVRAKHLVSQLRKLRGEGMKRRGPAVLAPGSEAQSAALIAWRLPCDGEGERGTSWLADSTALCQRVSTYVVQAERGLDAPSAVLLRSRPVLQVRQNPEAL